MVAPIRPDKDADPFHPPEVPVQVQCLHCGQEYDSYRIEWREQIGPDGRIEGFWCCPIPDCDGKGFGFDILPTDPNYRDERGGWCCEGDVEEDEAGSGDDLDDDLDFGINDDLDFPFPTDDGFSGGRSDDDLPW